MKTDSMCVGEWVWQRRGGRASEIDFLEMFANKGLVKQYGMFDYCILWN